MSSSSPMSGVDMMVRSKRDIPGPGMYGLPNDPRRDNKRGAKMGPAPKPVNQVCLPLYHEWMHSIVGVPSATF
jgi:hypothetical protein